MKGNFTSILSAAACVACFSAPASADLTTEVIHTINSTNSTLEMIDGDGETLAWRDTGDGRLYYWDGNTVQAISPSGQGVWWPSLDNGQIAYKCYDSATMTYDSLCYWDGTYNNGQPNIVVVIPGPIGDVSINDGRIAWTASDGNDNEVFYWDGTYNGSQPNITQLTNDSVSQTRVQISSGLIAWMVPSSGNLYDIYYWDGATTHLLDTTNAPVGVGNISVDGGAIAWSGPSNTTSYTAIYYWDGTFTSGSPNIETAVDEGYGFVRRPSLHQGNISYVKDGEDEAIFYWNGTSNTQLSEWYSIDGQFRPANTSTGVFYIGRNAITDLHEVRYVTSTGLCL